MISSDPDLIPSIPTTQPIILFPIISSGTPTTADRLIVGWLFNTASISPGSILYPLLFIKWSFLPTNRGGPQGLDRFATNLRCTVLGVMPPPAGRREPENLHRCFDSMPRRVFGRKDSNADVSRCRK